LTTVYLLFDGTSSDGRGDAKYCGKTGDKTVAVAHYKKCDKNPYSVGKVMVATDTAFYRAFDETLRQTGV